MLLRMVTPPGSRQCSKRLQTCEVTLATMLVLPPEAKLIASDCLPDAIALPLSSISPTISAVVRVSFTEPVPCWYCTPYSVTFGSDGQRRSLLVYKLRCMCLSQGE